ncbi:uncharacterized protein [Coffea arabica]|uniref:DNA helicase Pif1-like 2B domain-containing protein n=1 Tax=Coffea arabica TaxID=13443 RepID=A0ABM4V3B0_COFAR
MAFGNEQLPVILLLYRNQIPIFLTANRPLQEINIVFEWDCEDCEETAIFEWEQPQNLYVALSRVRNSSAVKALIALGTSDDIKTWLERSRTKVIGRLVTVELRKGERYNIKLLLTHVQKPTLFDDLLMVRGHKTGSFREACLQLGLLESDSYIEEALQEAAHFQMPYLLRSLLAMLLFYCSPKNPKHLWQTFEVQLSSDYERSCAHRHCTSIEIKRKVLQDINSTLEHMEKTLMTIISLKIPLHPVMDEASMEKTETIEAVHCLLTDIMESDRLATNMIAALDPVFSAFFIGVGEDVEHVDELGQMSLPTHMVVFFHNKEESLDRLLFGIVFPDLNLYSCNPYRMINRCVLCPKNSSVDEINKMTIAKFPENLHRYRSGERTVDKRNQIDYEDFLNSFNPKGLPSHELLRNENCPTMLLRNVNPTDGLCNGTREPVFSHGKLSVALSRVRNSSAVKALSAPEWNMLSLSKTSYLALKAGPAKSPCKKNSR